MVYFPGQQRTLRPGVSAAMLNTEDANDHAVIINRVDAAITTDGQSPDPKRNQPRRFAVWLPVWEHLKRTLYLVNQSFDKRNRRVRRMGADVIANGCEVLDRMVIEDDLETLHHFPRNSRRISYFRDSISFAIAAECPGSPRWPRRCASRSRAAMMGSISSSVAGRSSGRFVSAAMTTSVGVVKRPD